MEAARFLPAALKIQAFGLPPPSAPATVPGFVPPTVARLLAALPTHPLPADLFAEWQRGQDEAQQVTAVGGSEGVGIERAP